MVSRLVAIGLFLFTQLSFAELSPAEHGAAAKELANDFYAAQLRAHHRVKKERKLGTEFKLHQECKCGDTCPCAGKPPSPIACFEYACSKLGSFGCDDQSEINAVLGACRGNYGDDCLKAVCPKVGTFGCDDQSEIVTLANACRGNYDMSCFEVVCKKLGTFGCDDQNEVVSVLNNCGGGH